MSKVMIQEGENLDNALRRFKRTCAGEGIIKEVRKRECYLKPSVKRKEKSKEARKRNKSKRKFWF